MACLSVGEAPRHFSTEADACFLTPNDTEDELALVVALLDGVIAEVLVECRFCVDDEALLDD